MKKVFLMGILVALVNVAMCQLSSTVKDLNVTSGFKLASNRVIAISTDSSAGSKIGNFLITERAAKLYADGNGGGIITGGTITTMPAIGTPIPAGLPVGKWIEQSFYGTQPPTATLSGGTTFEMTIPGTVVRTLSWGAGRQAATNNLASIVVGGVSQTFSNPAAGAGVSGTQSVTVTTNATNTFSNTVLTDDGKSASASTSFIYRNKMYIGYVPTAAPTDANLIATTGNFATSFIAAGTIAAPTGSSYIVFAWPASFGMATIKINGLAVGYNLTTRSFINSSGYTTTYNIYVSPFTTTGGIDYQIL